MSIVLLGPVAFAPDLVEAVFAVFGHHNRELSHSLPSLAIGATLVAVIYAAVSRNGAQRVSESLMLFALYVSHWPADFITGLKPTWPGGPVVGLLLYDHPAADAAVECAIILACCIVYRRTVARSAPSVVSLEMRQLTSVAVPIALIIAQIAFDIGQAHLLS